jgi:hypothetical protein
MYGIDHLVDMGDSIRGHHHSKAAAEKAYTDGRMHTHNLGRSHKMGQLPVQELPRDRSRSPVREAPAANPERKGVKGKAKKMATQVAKAEHDRLLSEIMPTLKKGALTKTAKAEGYHAALPFAKDVLAHPEAHTETTRKRAQFLVNIQRK